MKHLLAVTALATGILASLPGLAQDKTVVSFLHKFPEPENMAYFDAAVAEFEAANPTIDIVMEAVADEPYKDKIRVLMASDQVPDIYFSWSGEFGRKFAREGRTLDLTEALAGPEWQGRFAAASLEPFQFEGKQFGIPVNVDSKYMIYNKAIFEKHGLAVPTTFADFIALNDALLAAGEVPIAYGNQAPWAATHYIGDLFAKMVPDDVRQADYQLLAPADQLYTHPAMSRLWRCTNPSATRVISTTVPTRSRISKRGARSSPAGRRWSTWNWSSSTCWPTRRWPNRAGASSRCRRWKAPLAATTC
jgi:raffinose/stachyose/melibiose transport system substrate-binding protein